MKRYLSITFLIGLFMGIGLCGLLVATDNLTTEAAAMESAAKEVTVKKGKTYLVGFAQDTMGNDWRIAQVRGLEREFIKYPFIKFFYTNAKGQTAGQIKDIEDMINMNVDVLVTSPRDVKIMVPVISRAYKKGIPVVLISRRIEIDDFTIMVEKFEIVKIRA